MKKFKLCSYAIFILILSGCGGMAPYILSGAAQGSGGYQNNYSQQNSGYEMGIYSGEVISNNLKYCEYTNGNVKTFQIYQICPSSDR